MKLYDIEERIIILNMRSNNPSLINEQLDQWIYENLLSKKRHEWWFRVPACLPIYTQIETLKLKGVI